MKNECDFQKAWEHHKKENKHHMENMKSLNDQEFFIYTIEMICDWLAMARIELIL